MGTKIDLSGEWGFRLDEEKRGIEEHFEKAAASTNCPENLRSEILKELDSLKGY